MVSCCLKIMSVYENGIFHTWQRTGHLCRFDGDEMILGTYSFILMIYRSSLMIDSYLPELSSRRIWKNCHFLQDNYVMIFGIHLYIDELQVKYEFGVNLPIFTGVIAFGIWKFRIFRSIILYCVLCAVG